MTVFSKVLKSALLCVLFTCLPTQAADHKTELNAGETLPPGVGIFSKSGNFVLIMENVAASERYGQFSTFATQNFSLDRNTVMSSNPTFNLGTSSRKAQKLAMQTDGNLAAYDFQTDAYLWDAQTNGQGATKLIVEEDGSVSLLKSNESMVWNSLAEANKAAPANTMAQAAVPPQPSAPTQLSDFDAKIEQLKLRFVQGMIWTNDNIIMHKGGEHRGCSGFAMAAFQHFYGDAKENKHTDFNAIKVGDVIRINGDTHSVVVIAKDHEKFTLAEGNYGGKVHWGRTVPVAEFRSSFNYAISPQL